MQNLYVSRSDTRAADRSVAQRSGEGGRAGKKVIQARTGNKVIQARRAGHVQGGHVPAGAVVQRYGTVTFSNVDTTKPLYASKVNDLTHALQNAPIIQQYLADKNAIVLLEPTSKLAYVRVEGDQVQIRIAPWFFEQASRGKIIGLLAHELGVHPIGDANLTGLEQNQETHDTTNQTAFPTGHNGETLSYDGTNQADHIFTATAGQPRYLTYQTVVFDLVTTMINQAAQHNATVTNAHITEVILSYLADLATISSTNDHRKDAWKVLDKTATYFNLARGRWLNFVQNDPAIVALTPPVQTKWDVAGQVLTLVGKAILSLGTASVDNTRHEQQRALGGIRALTPAQRDIAAAHGFGLQPSPHGDRPGFLHCLDDAQGIGRGQSTTNMIPVLVNGIPQINDPQRLATVNRYLNEIQLGTVPAQPSLDMIDVMAWALGVEIRVLRANGVLDVRGAGNLFTLVEVQKPAVHYRFAM